jgi:hypothetical protein
MDGLDGRTVTGWCIRSSSRVQSGPVPVINPVRPRLHWEQHDSTTLAGARRLFEETPMSRQLVIGIFIGFGGTVLLELVGALIIVAWHVHKRGFYPS